MQPNHTQRMLRDLMDPVTHAQALRDFDGHPPEFQAAVIVAVPSGDILDTGEVELISLLCRRAKVQTCGGGILMQYFSRMILFMALERRGAHYPNPQTIRAMVEWCVLPSARTTEPASRDPAAKREKPLPIAPLGLPIW